MKYVTLYLLVAVVGSLQAVAGADPGSRGDSSAHQLLERMSAAAQMLNYSGTFVYQHEGMLEAMQVVHVMDELGERERLFSLTGPKREVLRNNQVVTCILGDQQSVVVSKAMPRTPFPAGFPAELDALGQYYSFSIGDEDRVAGLDCRQIEVKPRDLYRYGRTLCVHEDSYLLLRSELNDADGQTIEQVLFTSVEFPDSIPDAELLPGLNDAGFTWHRQPEQQPEPGSQPRDSVWEAMQVPPGFMLTDHRWHRLAEDQNGVEHWMYSDGLASVSIYIEKSGQEDDYSGIASRGAMNAYGTVVNGYNITVVGEVPAQTVEVIAKSVQIR